MLGLTAGYAMAGRPSNESPLEGSTVDPADNPVSATPTVPEGQGPSRTGSQTQAGTPSRSQEPSAPVPGSSQQGEAPVASIPPASAPDVVVIPVEPPKPAQPGGSGGGGSQPSSGSN